MNTRKSAKAMTKGWIKLNRQMQDHWIWNDGEYDKAHAWIDLIMLANHEDKDVVFDYEVVKICRGQFITSIRKLANRWKWSTERTLKYLRLLEQAEMVHRDSNTKRTLITIVNYDKYQDVPNTNEDTDEDTNRTQTEHGSAHGSDTNKNIKNDKNEKNIKHIYGEYKHVKLTDKELERLKNDYGEEDTSSAIKFLDEYIQEKPGYKSKDHNLAMRRWVFDAVAEKKKRNPIARSRPNESGSTTNTRTDEEQRNADIDRYLESDEYKQLVGTEADMPFM